MAVLAKLLPLAKALFTILRPSFLLTAMPSPAMSMLPKRNGAERILARCGLYSQPLAFKLIATAANYIEGTIEQTVFTACVLPGSVQLPFLS